MKDVNNLYTVGTVKDSGHKNHAAIDGVCPIIPDLPYMGQL